MEEHSTDMIHDFNKSTTMHIHNIMIRLYTLKLYIMHTLSIAYNYYAQIIAILCAKMLQFKIFCRLYFI